MSLPAAPVALITGAASGIGAATARLIAPRTGGLALHTRSERGPSRDRLEAVAMEMRKVGADVRTLTGDLAQAGTGVRLVAEALAAFGRLDQLVANAGFADRRGTDDLQRADFDRSYQAMAGSLFEMAQAARKALSASPQGRIIAVSSFVAHRFVADALFPASAAAKAAAEALMRSLAVELGPAGVTVNSVIPGYTRKDGGHSALPAQAWSTAANLVPLRRIGEPLDVAHLIAFLLSSGARHITGQAIAVDGGLSLA